MKKNKPGLILLALILISLTYSCYYYRVNTIPEPIPSDMRWYAINGKYFILHYGESAWHLEKFFVDTNQFSGVISPLPSNHKMYLTTDPNKNNQFIKKRKELYQGDVLNEVHIYTSELEVTDSLVNCPFSSLQRIEVYEYASGPSTASHVIPAVLIPVTVVIGIVTIIALTKSSCPYVYIMKDDKFEFIGEIYSGAVYGSLERDDFLPLPFYRSGEGNYQVKIANELPEIQYLNQVELCIVNHPDATGVLMDRYGKTQVISSPVAPSSVFSAGGSDLSGFVNEKDGINYFFDEGPEAGQDSSALNSVIMTFAIPEGQDNGKLVVNAKNSFWGDYIFGEFTKKFGKAYGKWVRHKAKEPPDNAMQWKKDQSLPLMVYVETTQGWQFVDYFDMAGPLAFRDMVMPINFANYSLPENEKGTEVKIKIETGFMFWELDYVAMDLTTNADLQTEIIKPQKAVSESGKNVHGSLLYNDDRYYIQDNTGDEVILDFNIPVNANDRMMSVFLHARGYYEHVRKFTGPPEKTELLTFRKPGKLSEFSYKRFQVEKNRYEQWASLKEKK